MEDHSSRGKIGVFIKQGLHKGHDVLLKEKLVIEHALGLGHKPNVIPPDTADINGELRPIAIGWHPVGGLGGKWFAEKTGLGKKITETIHKYPDPSQHWAVLVGEFVHELWMDEHLDVIYINEKINPDEWHKFDVGNTRFNDEALRQAGEMVIHNMRATRPAYNIISNNCQNFAVNMLDAVQIGAHLEFATSFQVYQRATGKGEIKDLFVDNHPEEQAHADEQAHANVNADVDVGAPAPALKKTNMVQEAQRVMEENTTKLDNHQKLFS